jgi:3-methyl-2-oxobutanoate hydroxymethyltransferase
MKSTDFHKKKQKGQKISVLTCYDYPSAQMAAQTQLDCLLVGDTVAMTVHGYPSTVSATLDMMVTHTQAVSRGLGNQFLISDLPFLSYRGSLSETMHQVKLLMQAGAHAIKLEGGDKQVCHTVMHLVRSGIAVIGHIGLTPQSVHQLGGYGVQGRKSEDAKRLLQEAQALEAAGCTALVLECIPTSLAQEITQTLSIPTIGIGAGPHTDGQVLVWHDLLGLQTELKPKFLKQYARLSPLIQDALNLYHHEVLNLQFPTAEYSYD